MAKKINSSNFGKILVKSVQEALEITRNEPKYEMHADGVKEVDECQFCSVPCNEPHCPYTKEKE